MSTLFMMELLLFALALVMTGLGLSLQLADFRRLLDRIRALPPDSKLERLKHVIAELRADGYRQVMVFTQYTDTMDSLRDALRMDDKPLDGGQRVPPCADTDRAGDAGRESCATARARTSRTHHDSRSRSRGPDCA